MTSNTSNTSKTSKMIRRPKVFYTPEEKEQRMQAIRNRVPKDIVELIISFVSFSDTYRQIQNVVDRLYTPDYTIQRGFYQMDMTYRWRCDFVVAFEELGERIQNGDFTRFNDPIDYYKNVHDDTLRMIDLIDSNPKKRVFHTREVYTGMCNRRYIPLENLMMDMYKNMKPDFIMEQYNLSFASGSGSLRDGLKITVKKGQKKEFINFLKGFGRFIDWIKYKALPIHSMESTVSNA